MIPIQSKQSRGTYGNFNLGRDAKDFCKNLNEADSFNFGITFLHQNP